MKEWFQSWFDSPYYHILYKDRDQKEADDFLDNLLTFLKLPQGSEVLDIACGKGRHSLHLNSKGYIVTGIDLSQQSIAYCKQFENDSLEFYVHDMRELFRTNCFDLAVNIFTSFGYFANEHDNLLALRSAALALKNNGIFVLDFFNPEKVKAGDEMSFVKKVSDISFNIHKKVETSFIYKDIHFNDKGVDYKFSESVQLIEEKKFKEYFQKTGLTILHTFGNYALQPYDAIQSDRLIFITQKAV